VLDIFGGSNITGSLAQELGRYWLAFEMDEEYIRNSELRFMDQKEAEQRFGHRFGGENTNLSSFDEENPATSN
jgi:site-specific DNA-methyltransferase (cytosine-N4-specific)